MDLPRTDDGAQALDYNQVARRYQYVIISGCAASDGSGALEVDVASGEAVVNGTRHSVSSSTVTLSAGGSDPRKDVVYINSSGSVAVAEGTPSPAKPAAESRRDTYEPAPPDLAATDATPVAEVWVPANASDIGSADISDRRLFADAEFGELGADLVSTEDIVDGGSISHTGRLADLGESFLATYAKTVGGGSVSDNSGVVELREPGNATATSESRIYSHIFEFDPSQSRFIRVNITNITIDDNKNARIEVGVSDTPDADTADDEIRTSVRGNGDILAITEENNTLDFTTDSSQNNAYISGLDSIKISWDGSTLTVTTDDGSTTVTVTDSSNYPSGENLFLTIVARDSDDSNARNADFDVDSVDIGS